MRLIAMLPYEDGRQDRKDTDKNKNKDETILSVCHAWTASSPDIQVFYEILQYN